jgi:hypothetical protein
VHNGLSTEAEGLLTKVPATGEEEVEWRRGVVRRLRMMERQIAEGFDGVGRMFRRMEDALVAGMGVESERDEDSEMAEE